MAIKRLMRSAEIADSPFRSLQEVEKYLGIVKQNLDDQDQLLKQYQRRFSKVEKACMEKAAGFTFKINTDEPGEGKKHSPKIDVQKVDKIVIPKMDTLRNNFAIVNTLTEQVDMLTTMHSQMSVTFRGVRGSAETLKSILTLKRSAEAKLEAALSFLNEIGKKYAPSDFRELVEQTASGLSEELTFSKYKTAIYCNDLVDESLAFTYYIKLEGLEDEGGDQYPEFYIVFTAHLTPSGKQGEVMKSGRIKGVESTTLDMEYFLTVMHSFDPPGKFNPGKKVRDAKEALNVLGQLLALESIGNTLGNIPHRLDKVDKDQLRSGDLISTIDVEDDALMFWFKVNVNQEQAAQAAKFLWVDVKKMLAHIKKANLKARFHRDGRRYGVKFTLNMPANEEQLDVHSIQFLKDHFALDDVKLKKVINILNQ